MTASAKVREVLITAQEKAAQDKPMHEKFAILAAAISEVLHYHIPEALHPAQPVGERTCKYCEKEAEPGRIETDNNGPIVDCPMCVKTTPQPTAEADWKWFNALSLYERFKVHVDDPEKYPMMADFYSDLCAVLEPKQQPTAEVAECIEGGRKMADALTLRYVLVNDKYLSYDYVIQTLIHAAQSPQRSAELVRVLKEARKIILEVTDNPCLFISEALSAFGEGGK